MGNKSNDTLNPFVLGVSMVLGLGGAGAGGGGGMGGGGVVRKLCLRPVTLQQLLTVLK